MSPSKVQLPWGKEHIQLSLPDAWRVQGIMEPGALPGIADIQAELVNALQQPIGMPRFSDLVKPGQPVAIVMDDASRPTPVSKLLPSVLAELRTAGVLSQHITLVTAPGVHRPMEQAEIQVRAGTALDGIRWENPDADDQARMLNLGTTSRGTPVWINRTVAEASLVISIGCIEPHIIASFGGGYKNLVPGVAGRATIAHNHSLNCTPGTFNMVGQPIERNPMRLDLEEAADMLKGQVFIVNAVLNAALEVVRIVCGHPGKAHREGTRTSAEIYGVKVPSQADVVITNSCPMDSDLRQGVKALANTIRAVKPGGVVVVLVKADEGVGVFGLANRKLPVGRGGLQLLSPLLIPMVPKLKLKGMGEEDRFFLYFALQAMHHATIYMYAPTIPLEIHERLPFVLFKDTPEAALQSAMQRFPRQADVLIFPHGGSTYPILPQ